MKKIDLAALAQELELRLKAEESLYEFFKQAWHIIEPGYEFVDNWHIAAACEHLEAVTNGKVRRLLINFPPRLLKTDITSVAWPAWEWIRHPARKFLYGSYSFTLAEDASIKCRRLLESEWYQTRWGDRFTLLEDRNKKDHFANDRGGERIVTSPDSTMTGRGADRVVADDPNSVRDQSEQMLQSTLQWWTQVVPTRLNDPQNSSLVVVQQRTHERDVSGHILAHDRAGWVHLCLPNEFEARRRCVTVVLPSSAPNKWQDPRKYEGELLFERRIDKEHIRRLKANLGEYGYSGQFQQRPAPAEGGIIKKHWFQPWKQAKRPTCNWIIQSWDTALSSKDKAAFSCCHTYGVWKTERGTPALILLARWRARVEYPELRKTALQLAEDYLNDDWKNPRERIDPKRRPNMIIVEAKSSGDSLISDFARAGIRATPFRPDRKYGDKVERVRRVTHLLESGMVYVPYQGPSFERPFNWVDQFLISMTSFPNAESRDDVDVLTQALLRLSVSGWVFHPDDQMAKPKKRYAESLDSRPLY